MDDTRVKFFGLVCLQSDHYHSSPVAVCVFADQEIATVAAHHTVNLSKHTL